MGVSTFFARTRNQLSFLSAAFPSTPSPLLPLEADDDEAAACCRFRASLLRNLPGRRDGGGGAAFASSASASAGVACGAEPSLLSTRAARDGWWWSCGAPRAPPFLLDGLQHLRAVGREGAAALAQARHGLRRHVALRHE